MAHSKKNLIGWLKKKRPVDDPRIVITGGRTSVDESYNRLKDNILHFGSLNKKVLQVESTIVGEGKTTVVCNLGASLALNGKKVIVVDLDFRNPAVGKAFNVSEACGIGDYVLDGVKLDDIVKTSEYGVDVITRGREFYNSSLVLDSKKMQELIDVLKEKYDFVLLDCPPVLMMTDYMHIAKYSDGILYTVSARFVKKSAVRDSLSLISRLDVPIIGSVMTCVASEDAFYGYKMYWL
jgi:capsular exopolysaccharide synthesis family protein